MKEEDHVLCEKGEWFKRRLSAVGDGKLVHEAGRIGNALCNSVSNLRHICSEIAKLKRHEESSWTAEEAEDYYETVRSLLMTAVVDATEFCRKHDIG